MYARGGKLLDFLHPRRQFEKKASAFAVRFGSPRQRQFLLIAVLKEVSGHIHRSLLRYCSGPTQNNAKFDLQNSHRDTMDCRADCLRSIARRSAARVASIFQRWGAPSLLLSVFNHLRDVQKNGPVSGRQVCCLSVEGATECQMRVNSALCAVSSSGTMRSAISVLLERSGNAILVPADLS